MVGDATNRYIDDNPSLCEVVTYINDTDENDTNGTGHLIPLVTELDLIDCPKALEVAIAITFITGLIMVRVEQCVYVCVCVCVCVCVYVRAYVRAVHTVYLWEVFMSKAYAMKVTCLKVSQCNKYVTTP